jgi:hypothetical protein
MTVKVEKTVPKSLQEANPVRLGNLSPAFKVARSVPASLKEPKAGVKLGNLSPVFGIRRA